MNYILSLLLLTIPLMSQAQVKTERASKLASVMEEIGITDVTINYSRPAVNGREGKIWGALVPYGFYDYHYGTSTAAPWRAGANENTTIEFSTDVTIEGKPLPAGKYGFFIAMGADKATLIFSKDNNAWGSFYYDSLKDKLRVDVPVIKTADNVERLTYEFSTETDTSAVAYLQWEKVKIPFTIMVDLKKTQVEAYRQAFNSGAFYVYWQNMQQAASFCLTNNVNIDEGLTWADRSINTYFGEANFRTLSTYAGLLDKVGRVHESDSIMKVALPKGSAEDIYFFASSVLRSSKAQAACKMFQYNYDKSPKDWLANLGMAKRSAVMGDKPSALKFADASSQMVQDQDAKAYVGQIRQAIMDGKNVADY
jgi:hypothetical protein